MHSTNHALENANWQIIVENCAIDKLHPETYQARTYAYTHVMHTRTRARKVVQHMGNKPLDHATELQINHNVSMATLEREHAKWCNALATNPLIMQHNANQSPHDNVSIGMLREISQLIMLCKIVQPKPKNVGIALRVIHYSSSPKGWSKTLKDPTAPEAFWWRGLLTSLPRTRPISV